MSAARLPIREAVVIVHGLWMHGIVMRILGWRLRAAGFSPYYFNYATRRRDVREAAAELSAWLQSQLPNARIHFVAHSLGGLVVLTMLQEAKHVRVGRVVTLGSPLAGSSVARHLGKSRWGVWLLGGALALLAEGIRAIPNSVELGTVAGTVPIGLGRFLAPMPTPNDGTVALVEASLPGCTDHVALPVTHFALLTSSRVAAQVVQFLRSGRFLDLA